MGHSREPKDLCVIHGCFPGPWPEPPGGLQGLGLDCGREEAGKQQVEFLGNRWACCESHHSTAYPSLGGEGTASRRPLEGLKYVPKSV